MILDERPFCLDPWRGDRREASRAIWEWRAAIRSRAVGHDASADDFVDQAALFRRERTTDLVDRDTLGRVLKAAESFDLDLEHLALQIQSAGRLAGPIRFAIMSEQRHFLAGWVYPHGRLLASLGGVAGPLYAEYVDSLSAAYFMLGHLLHLPECLQRDHLFIPEEELATFGVMVDRLRYGPPDDLVRKLLWKQCVRVRDYFARALPLSRDLPRRYRTGFRRWWLGGLEVVNAIERRGYDLWSEPIRLSAYHRAQARFQARFSRVPLGSK